MKTTLASHSITKCILLGIFIAGFLSAYGGERGSQEWTNYFVHAVQEGMSFTLPTNEIVRSGTKTNVVQVFTGNRYRNCSSSEYKVRTGSPLVVNASEWYSDDGGRTQRVRVCIMESKTGRDEAMEGLSNLMSSHTSMGGVAYKVLKDGPGDICYTFRSKPADVTIGPNVLFFCRNNVAVQVSLRSADGDVMSAARLVDMAIQGSYGKP